MAEAAAAQLAKGALRRLAAQQLEPTPANYARAYAEEAGEAPPAEAAASPRAKALIERLAMRVSDDPALRGELATALVGGRWDDLQRALDRSSQAQAGQGQAWARLLGRLAQGLERGGRHWTLGRKKDSLARVLDGSHADPARLLQRLGQLMGAWERDQDDAEVDLDDDTAAAPAVAMPAMPAMPAGADGLPQVVEQLAGTVRAGLPPQLPRALALADELAALASAIACDGATPELGAAVAELCGRIQRVLGLRHELVDELLALARTCADGVVELAEDASWARGQAQALQARLVQADSARAVRAARELMEQTRAQQRSLQAERLAARDALRQVVQQVLLELGDLGDATGRFSDQVGQYAQRIAAADSLQALAGLVQELLGDSRAVHQVVDGARQRLAGEHARAAALEAKVRELESELRRLSDEVSTDPLTQVANRRGLERAFEAERVRMQVQLSGADATAASAAAGLAVGLIDIDNFKKLNDSLGHAAGDEALKSLAARVTAWLRPADRLARFGGEEFVVLLPETPVDEAQQALTRLQRQLTASLFMHEGKEVFVTFSAGVTAWRPGEPLADALQRADEGLYEAKRSGKNRTCIA
ncbi:MAG: GGDEF domain-containing protein [Burkholderiaceae bacterium]|nr:GGDEF domain-containing protein [Burkholderiaceae bacterium]